MQLTRKRDRPLDRLSEKDLRRRLAAAQRRIDSLPDAPDGREAIKLMPALQAATAERRAAAAELARRDAERARTEREEQLAPVRAAQRRAAANAGRSTAHIALDLVARLAHPEVRGLTLVAGRLSEQEGEELHRLARRRIDGQQPLSDDETRLYERLIGKASGNDNLFAEKRAEKAEVEKTKALQAAERRHPQADDLVAAVLGERELFEGLRHRLRETNVVDEYGRSVPGAVAGVIYEPSDIAALFIALAVIVADRGNPIAVNEHGGLGDGLPPIRHANLAHLARNGWLTLTPEGAGSRIGLGERTRRIAKKWSIDLPDGA